MVYGKGGPYGKRTKRRVIPLTDRAFRLLSNVFERQDRLPFKKRWAEHIVKRVAKRAGIAKPVTPHSLRHSFAVACLKRGIGLRTLRLLLGHDHLTTTETYLRPSPEDVIREFEDKWTAPRVADEGKAFTTAKEASHHRSDLRVAVGVFRLPAITEASLLSTKRSMRLASLNTVKLDNPIQRRY
jgi:hypothetical protein